MFGIGLSSAYGSITFDWLGGANAALLYALFVRLLVGIGWFFTFKRAGRNPLLAFAPIVGTYTAFRMVWDDFSFAFIFSTTTIIAFIDGIMTGEGNAIITACAVINFVMWWLYALLCTRAFGVGIVLGFLTGGVPWLGTLLMGVWPSAEYKGPWSSDPNNEQNLTTQERKTRRKKAAKEAKRQEELEKKRLREERRQQRETE